MGWVGLQRSAPHLLTLGILPLPQEFLAKQEKVLGLRVFRPQPQVQDGGHLVALKPGRGAGHQPQRLAVVAVLLESLVGQAQSVAPSTLVVRRPTSLQRLRRPPPHASDPEACRSQNGGEGNPDEPAASPAWSDPHQHTSLADVRNQL